MESSRSKVEAMKPVLLKAGIPLAVSLAGFILARIATRKSCFPTASSLPPDIQVDVQETDSYDIYTDEESFHSLDSECSHSSRVEDDHAYAEEILGLRRRIEDIQDRELQLEKRFLYYQGLKDQEIVLMELHNKMVLEMNRVEFLEREVSLVEAENQRFESVAKEYLRLLRLDEFLRSENELLRERVKKLLRRTKEHSRILRKQCLQIQCNETEISSSKNELQEKADCMRLMQDEIKEMKFIIEELQGEKNELLCNLRAAEESSAASKVEGEKVTIEDYNRLAHGLEQLEKHKASEVRELMRSKSCLSHELMRRRSQEHTEENKETSTSFRGIEEFGSDNELNQCSKEQGGSYLGLTARDHAHSKRRKLIAKFKRWVEGSEKTKQSSLVEKEKHRNKCFPRHSVSHGAEDAHFPARKSCSSI
ncbi:hypothetical protein C2S51_034146 [Perilla frutescens var. frutescens]|nr:hypothetical protein C2S51_034146 [Perilla frutescens var. frutescens]